MKIFKRNEALKKSKRPASSIVLYGAAIVVGIVGITYLVTNIMMYRTNVDQYVAQGYALADVTSQLLTSQLLPGIYEPIAVYGGIALLLYGAGMINQKISKCLKMLGDLGIEGSGTNTDEIDVGGLDSKSLKSNEFEASEFETGKSKAAGIETDEHDLVKPQA